MKKHLFVLAAFLFCRSTLYGQEGGISGTVTDPSGAVVPGAEVTVTDAGTGQSRSAITNPQGHYVIPALRPGDYSLRVDALGFRKYSQSGIVLRADQRVTVNVALLVGETEATVTVDAGAQQVDTQTSTLTQVVDERRMVDLPLNGRNAAKLTLLVAGAVSAPDGGADTGSTKTFPGAVTISTNGSRQNQISYTLDGGSYMDTFTNVNQPFPFPDALQEFSVQTSNYGAQFGNNAGGVVNVITKSGTNAFHGDLFAFHRNKVLNARNFFQSERDPLKRTQFGGTLGGPIVHNRTFFFGGYQGNRIRSTLGGLSAFVPTNANREGDFSALLDAANPNNPLARRVTILDPVTRQPFPDNIIPKNRFNAAGIAFLEHIPRADGNGRIRYGRAIHTNFDEFIVKVDHQFTSTERGSIRYITNVFDDASGFDGSNLLTLNDFSRIRSQNVVLNENSVFSGNLINDARFSFSRVASLRNMPENAPRISDFGVDVWQPDGQPGIEFTTVTGFFSVGDFPRARFVRNDFSWTDDLKWVRGRHSLAIGGSFQRSRLDIDNGSRQLAWFYFTNDDINYAIASVFTGTLRRFVQGTGEFRNNRNSFVGLYVQDNFRVTRRLSLNLGLRWDPYLPWNEIQGRIQVFDPKDFAAGKKSQFFVNSPPGLLFPEYGDPGPEHGTTSDLDNFAPRLGFAWDVFGNGRTSLRGGAGVFYDSRQVANLTTVMSNSNAFGGVQIDVTQPPGPFNDPFGDQPNPFPASPAPSPTTSFPSPVAVVTFAPGEKFKTTTAYNWNLAIEHQLLADWLARGAYVGSHGSHILENVDANAAVFIPGSTLRTDLRRPFLGLGQVRQATPDVNSNYHGLQLTMEKRTGGDRFWGRSSVLANYTYSRSIDTLPFGTTLVGFGGRVSALAFGNAARRSFETGVSEFDHTHRMVTSYILSLPSFTGANSWMRTVFGDWQATGIFEAQSGGPLTILAGSDISQTALGSDRVDFVGGSFRGTTGCGVNEAPCVGYLNTAAFARPLAGSAGNVGKGAFRGPGFFTWDMGFFKNFRIREGTQIQFRFEYFNIFNRANFQDPNNSFAAGGFGGIRGAFDPRIGQVALKIIF
jgi:hypothetical protein